jgi:transposase InsO family protein
VKQEVLDLVELTRDRTGWTTTRILGKLGLSKSRYHSWQRRARRERLEDGATVKAESLDQLLSEEKHSAIAYALSHPRDGYRRLAWQMIDEDVAFLSPSSVYRVLNEADLLSRWKRSARVGEPPPKPVRPNERWHTDIMYLRVEDSWFFLVTVIDAYSRYVVHWDLLSSMTAADVRLVIQEALERSGMATPSATTPVKPEIVSDNGSQFTSKDFKQLVRQFELKHIRIRTYHPESNGVVERYHRTTREEISEVELRNLSHAREIIAKWVRHYNEKRLHAGIGYMEPVVYYSGDPEERKACRAAKLLAAREERRRINAERLRLAA